MSFSPILQGRRILLIIGGGIAAYKSLELIRRLKERKADLDVILTKAAQAFITPLSAESLLGKPIFTELFASHEQHDVHHIRLARKAELIVFAPVTASRMAKLAHGFADDLANAVYLASHSPCLLCPAMNPSMWQHPATQRNKVLLLQNGHIFQGPTFGEMAEAGEKGLGRLSEIEDILFAIEAQFANNQNPLQGKHFIVTAGPTQEALDPVRYISNRSSGKQGYEIAKSLAARGARVTLISGPVALEAPIGTTPILVETAEEMLLATQKALPADGAIFVAAVSDWRFKAYSHDKLKKQPDQQELILTLEQTPDILATIAKSSQRPKLVVGFAAETDNSFEKAEAKRQNKGADILCYNNIRPILNPDGTQTKIMGGDKNEIILFTKNGTLQWPFASKTSLAEKLVDYCSEFLKENETL